MSLITFISAKSLIDLKEWCEVHEPPMTCNLTTSDVRRFIDGPMRVPEWPSHAQGIQRCVKQVTEAAGKVFSHDKRDGFIRAQEASCQLMSKNESKQDLMKLVQ